MLPKIEISQPVVVPSKEETVYDQGFIIGMGMGTHQIDHQEMFVDLRPYNGTLKELYRDNSKDERIFIPNIWVEAARSGLFAQVMGGICLVANLLLQEKNLLAKIAQVEADGGDTTELKAKLAEVEAGLQIVKE